MSKTIELVVPDQIVGTPIEKDYLETIQQILKEQTVLRLYREQKISTGRGAEMMGMPLYDFIRFLGAHQVSIFNLTDEELRADLEAALKASLPASQRQRERQKRHEAIAAYAAQYAGTEVDLDVELEQAAIEHLLAEENGKQ